MIKKYLKEYLPASVLKTIKPVCSKFYKYGHFLRARKYPIIQNPDKELEVVFQIKDETWEDIYYPECYGHNKEMHLKVFGKAEYIFKETNAVVSTGSDAVITSKGVYWSKFNQEEFVTWAKPSDINLAWFDRDNVALFKLKRKEYISGKVLSLLGDCAHHWAHCMFEFLPKLFSAGKAGLLNQEITILVVENVDKQILEIIKNYLKNFPKTRIRFVKKSTDCICEELYFMPIPGPSYADYKFRLDYVEFIPHYVLEDLKQYVIDPLIEKIKDNKPKYDKIFLPRNKAYTHTGRYLINYDEIHDFFKEQGYVDLEGSTMTLEEKADVFYRAKEVVGMYGSALVNFMFCNQAKCLNLSNYKFVTETCIYILNRDYISKMITVTGQDDGSEYGSNFYIPLEKIKKVYKEYMMDNNDKG